MAQHNSSRSSKGGKGSSGKGQGGSGRGRTPSQKGRPSSRSGGTNGKKGASRSHKGGPKGKSSGGAKKKQYSATTRSVEAKKRAEWADKKKRRRDLTGAAVNLPNWVIEGLERVTPNDRVAPALEALGAASEALGDGNFQAAVKHGLRAKALAPNDPTTRETIGLAAYRMGDWSMALNELRAYRRMAGETTHLPVEMDVLRAMGRDRDVEKAWKELNAKGGHGLVMNEGKVVYGSWLLDKGRVDEAWAVVDPGRIVDKPNEAHLRLYFVAGRVAAAAGDRDTAKRFSDTIVLTDPSFPGWEQLESEIAALAD